MRRRLALALALLLAGGALLHTLSPAGAQSMEPHPYLGIWVTADGRIRHEILPDGRYDEARGGRRSAYQGRCTITGNHIDDVDDTGFTADGEFIGGVLHHAGMTLRREAPGDGVR